MDPVLGKIAEVAEAVNAGFTSLEETITTEFNQVQLLIQQNEPTHAIQALENLKARVAAGFAQARASVANIVPEAPAGSTGGSTDTTGGDASTPTETAEPAQASGDESVSGDGGEETIVAEAEPASDGSGS